MRSLRCRNVGGSHECQPTGGFHRCMCSRSSTPHHRQPLGAGRRRSKPSSDIPAPLPTPQILPPTTDNTPPGGNPAPAEPPAVRTTCPGTTHSRTSRRAESRAPRAGRRRSHRSRSAWRPATAERSTIRRFERGAVPFGESPGDPQPQARASGSRARRVVQAGEALEDGFALACESARPHLENGDGTVAGPGSGADAGGDRDVLARVADGVVQQMMMTLIGNPGPSFRGAELLTFSARSALTCGRTHRPGLARQPARTWAVTSRPGVQCQPRVRCWAMVVMAQKARLPSRPAPMAPRIVVGSVQPRRGGFLGAAIALVLRLTACRTVRGLPSGGISLSPWL